MKMETATTDKIEIPPKLAEAFQLLKRGRHISQDDIPVFRDLKKNRVQYELIFSALGYQLEYHNRDFFYFKGDHSLKTATIQGVTLFVLILFQDMEEKKFQTTDRQWQKSLVTRIFKVGELPHFATSPRRRMMSTVNINESNLTEKIFRPLKQLGMLDIISDDRFSFRTPIYRFIDICLHIGEQDNFELQDLSESTEQKEAFVDEFDSDSES